MSGAAPSQAARRRVALPGPAAAATAPPPAAAPPGAALPTARRGRSDSLVELQRLAQHRPAVLVSAYSPLLSLSLGTVVADTPALATSLLRASGDLLRLLPAGARADFVEEVAILASDPSAGRYYAEHLAAIPPPQRTPALAALGSLPLPVPLQPVQLLSCGFPASLLDVPAFLLGAGMAADSGGSSGGGGSVEDGGDAPVPDDGQGDAGADDRDAASPQRTDDAMAARGGSSPSATAASFLSTLAPHARGRAAAVLAASLRRPGGGTPVASAQRSPSVGTTQQRQPAARRRSPLQQQPAARSPPPQQHQQQQRWRSQPPQPQFIDDNYNDGDTASVVSADDVGRGISRHSPSDTARFPIGRPVAAAAPVAAVAPSPFAAAVASLPFVGSAPGAAFSRLQIVAASSPSTPPHSPPAPLAPQQQPAHFAQPAPVAAASVAVPSRVLAPSPSGSAASDQRAALSTRGGGAPPGAPAGATLHHPLTVQGHSRAGTVVRLPSPAPTVLPPVVSDARVSALAAIAQATQASAGNGAVSAGQAVVAGIGAPQPALEQPVPVQHTGTNAAVSGGATTPPPQPVAAPAASHAALPVSDRQPPQPARSASGPLSPLSHLEHTLSRLQRLRAARSAPLEGVSIAADGTASIAPADPTGAPAVAAPVSAAPSTASAASPFAAFYLPREWSTNAGDNTADGGSSGGVGYPREPLQALVPEPATAVAPTPYVPEPTTAAPPPQREPVILTPRMVPSSTAHPASASDAAGAAEELDATLAAIKRAAAKARQRQDAIAAVRAAAAATANGQPPAAVAGPVYPTSDVVASSSSSAASSAAQAVPEWAAPSPRSALPPRAPTPAPAPAPVVALAPPQQPAPPIPATPWANHQQPPQPATAPYAQPAAASSAPSTPHQPPQERLPAIPVAPSSAGGGGGAREASRRLSLVADRIDELLVGGGGDGGSSHSASISGAAAPPSSDGAAIASLQDTLIRGSPVAAQHPTPSYLAGSAAVSSLDSGGGGSTTLRYLPGEPFHARYGYGSTSELVGSLYARAGIPPPPWRSSSHAATAAVQAPGPHGQSAAPPTPSGSSSSGLPLTAAILAKYGPAPPAGGHSLAQTQQQQRLPPVGSGSGSSAFDAGRYGATHGGADTLRALDAALGAAATRPPALGATPYTQRLPATPAHAAGGAGWLFSAAPTTTATGSRGGFDAPAYHTLQPPLGDGWWATAAAPSYAGSAAAREADIDAITRRYLPAPHQQLPPLPASRYNAGSDYAYGAPAGAVAAQGYGHHTAGPSSLTSSLAASALSASLASMTAAVQGVKRTVDTHQLMAATMAAAMGSVPSDGWGGSASRLPPSTPAPGRAHGGGRDGGLTALALLAAMPVDQWPRSSREQ